MAQHDIQLKLLVDSKARKVIFAEADKSFIDFLFNLLSLPLGTVVRLLKDHSMVGCLTNLYESIESLNDTYLQPNQSKDRILKPKVQVFGSPMLLPNVDFPTAKKFYLCTDTTTDCLIYVSDHPNAICPHCKKAMSYEAEYVKPPSENTQAVSGGEGGYVKGVVTYMVMDDLSVMPMSTVSSLALLNKFNIKDTSVLEEKVMTFGVNEAVKMLQTSLNFKTVLTDIFFGKNLAS